LRDNDLGAEDHFRSGTIVSEPDTVTGDVVSYFRDRGITVATGEPDPFDYPGGSYSNDYGSDYD